MTKNVIKTLLLTFLFTTGLVATSYADPIIAKSYAEKLHKKNVEKLTSDPVEQIYEGLDEAAVERIAELLEKGLTARAYLEAGVYGTALVALPANKAEAVVMLVIGPILGRTAKAVVKIKTSLRLSQNTINQIENPTLKRAMQSIFRKEDRLPGGTAGAVRAEKATGAPVGAKFHDEKAKNSINRLNNVIKKEKLSPEEKKMAESIKKDLEDALQGK